MGEGAGAGEDGDATSGEGLLALFIACVWGGGGGVVFW